MPSHIPQFFIEIKNFFDLKKRKAKEES